MSLIGVFGTIIGGNNVIAGTNNVIASGNHVIAGTNNVISGGTGAADGGDSGDNNETPGANKPAMIDAKSANRIARRLLNYYKPDKMYCELGSLRYSAKDMRFVKKFSNVNDVIVHIFPDSSEIQVVFFDENHNPMDTQKYPMTNRTKKLAQQAKKYFNRPNKDAEKALLIVLLTIVGGAVVVPISAALIQRYSPRQQRMRQQYNEFKSTLPDYSDSIRMAETPEEFARFKNLQEFNEQRLANYWTELNQSK